MKITLSNRIVAYVAKRDTVTIDELIGQFGRYVTASQAQRARDSLDKSSRKWWGTNNAQPSQSISRGVRRVVYLAASYAVRCGLIRRLRPGVYGRQLNRRTA